MSDLQGLGPRGEDYALELLRQRGHRLVERNFRCPAGELDLVTWQKDTLVFVEVRARAADPDRTPAESISPAKQRRIVRAAQWYLAQRLKDRAPPACRFDVVWIIARDAEIVDGGVMEGAFTA